MTVAREAFVLPGLFLTVALLGGLRVAASVRLLPPTLIGLVLGVLLLGALVQARVLRPDKLMASGRSPLENLSGLVVLLTLFAATAQVFNLVTPDSGLLHLLVSVFFLVQLLTTMAAVRDRIAMIRSLVVLLGCAFVLRFVALESLYAPGRGVVKRVMTALMEGVTLGALQDEPAGAVTGYLAFLALTLYVIGLILLAAPEHVGPEGLIRRSESILAESVAVPSKARNLSVLLIAILPVMACVTDEAARAQSRDGERAPSSELREKALAAAHVWRPPAVPVAAARLDENPPGPKTLSPTDEVSCRFVTEPVGGLTPKFNCQLADGEIVKVKYGRGNPEVYAEPAATRLLTALGFGADRMYVVGRVRCAGCPPMPYPSLLCFAKTGLESVCFAGGLNYAREVEFSPAVIERRMEGRKIEGAPDQGWAWHELDRIDPSRGGSRAAEVDAFRLMASFLAHWDNKSENQRLICLPGAERPDGSCELPLALIQDLGATFGPAKLDVVNWRRSPVWKDPSTCLVSMEHLPFQGATFPERRISDDGRRFLLGLLEQLNGSQLRNLFEGVGIARYDAVTAESRDVNAWVTAFQDKVRQIRDAGPCRPITSPPDR